MIDLTDSFPEGVKIFKKDNFRGKPVLKDFLVWQCGILSMIHTPTLSSI